MAGNTGFKGSKDRSRITPPPTHTHIFKACLQKRKKKKKMKINLQGLFLFSNFLPSHPTFFLLLVLSRV